MEITPFKQTLTHSCLAACFLMILKAQGQDFTEKDEQELALLGSRRIYASYMAGITSEVAKRYGKKIKILADNKFFTEVLQKSFDTPDIQVLHKPVTMKLIKELLSEGPLICHIDDNALGDYSHASHFIVIERATEQMITIVDPWSGERKKIYEKTLEDAILSLKNYLKMCPLLFKII